MTQMTCFDVQQSRLVHVLWTARIATFSLFNAVECKARAVEAPA
jgi:hypothetical protein